MTKADGRHSTQGTKPGFEYRPITEEEAQAGQSDKDLGARWGAGDGAGPRKTRRRQESPDQVVPGGLGIGTVPDGTESRRASLDQPPEGIDRPPEPSLDQASKASDRRESPDQAKQDANDRQEGQSQEQSSSGQQDGNPGSGSNPEGVQEDPGYESEHLEYADSLIDQEDLGNHGANYEGRNSDGSDTIGPRVQRYHWQRVFSKNPRYDERSDGSKDVEDLLENIYYRL